jgi:dTDP-4-dehydrorhamnose reductase
VILILEARDRRLSGLARGLQALGRKVAIAEGVELQSMKSVRAAVAAAKPTAVVLTGGMEDPLRCEEDPARAFVLNAEGAIHLAAAAMEFQAIPIAISTAAVLGDRGGEHGEDSPPSPTTTYAKSKHQGETFLLRAAAKRGLILRVGHVFEDGLAAERARLASAITASERELVSPIGAADLGTAIDRLLAASASGVVHVASHDSPVAELSLWRAIASACGVDAGRVETSQRQGGAALVSGRLSALGVKLRSWREALEDAASHAAPAVVEPVKKLAAGESLSGQGPIEIEVLAGKIVLESRSDQILKAGQSARIEGTYRIVAIDAAEIALK